MGNRAFADFANDTPDPRGAADRGRHRGDPDCRVDPQSNNSAILEICKELETVRLSEFESSLKGLGVSFDWPKVGLPLRHVEVPTSHSIAGAADAGIPVVAGYDTREAPLYPPEGLFVDATAIYDRVAGRPRFSLRYKASRDAKRAHLQTGS